MSKDTNKADKQEGMELIRDYMFDGDIRKHVTEEIYPHMLKLGEGKAQLMARLITDMVWNRGYRVVLHMSHEDQAKYGLSSNRIDITHTGVREFNVTNGVLNIDCSIGGTPTWLELPAEVLVSAYMVTKHNGLYMSLESIMGDLISYCVSLTIGELEEEYRNQLETTGQGSVVKVDFSKKKQLH